MKQRAKFLLESTLGLALLLAAVWPLAAQAPTPQKALAQSVADLQKAPTDTAQREKIIKLALEMKPAPAVPEEAKAAMASGTALFTAAKVPEDFKKAAAEFEKATLAAPWLAEAYYNLGSAQEKAGLLYEAAASLRLYLLATPKAPDAKVVGAHLNGLQQGLLKQFLADLQKTPANDALREKIIRLAVVMDPKPSVPAEAEKYGNRAEFAVKDAKSPGELADAAKEYEKALLLAPWVAAYYFNCGTVQERASLPEQAIRNYQLYLLAAPEAQDAKDVRKRIDGLEYLVEKAAKEKAKAESPEALAEKQRKAEEEFIGSLDGAYLYTFDTMPGGAWGSGHIAGTVRISIRDGEAVREEMFTQWPDDKVQLGVWFDRGRGVIRGREFEIHHAGLSIPCAISEDGRRITVQEPTGSGSPRTDVYVRQN